MDRIKIVFEHDEDPDFSWLEQSSYDPSKPDYDPIYPTKEDADAGRNAYAPEWYRNPENHVALCMSVYKMTDDDEDWQLADSLGGIDFLVDSDEWQTGTFYHYRHLSGYLQELAKEAGLPE